MNEQTQPNDFDATGRRDATPEQRPLDEHLKGITGEVHRRRGQSGGKSALADSWSRADVKKALEALGVGPGRIKMRFRRHRGRARPHPRG